MFKLGVTILIIAACAVGAVIGAVLGWFVLAANTATGTRVREDRVVRWAFDEVVLLAGNKRGVIVAALIGAAVPLAPCSALTWLLVLGGGLSQWEAFLYFGAVIWGFINGTLCYRQDWWVFKPLYPDFKVSGPKLVRKLPAHIVWRLIWLAHTAGKSIFWAGVVMQAISGFSQAFMMPSSLYIPAVIWCSIGGYIGFREGRRRSARRYGRWKNFTEWFIEHGPLPEKVYKGGLELFRVLFIMCYAVLGIVLGAIFWLDLAAFLVRIVGW